MPSATTIIDTMLSKDRFSQWLGIKRLEERPSYCRLSMTVTEEMCNGFGIAHGGITYSLADSALAFASNSSGKHAVSIETSIAHIKPVKAGETLTATAKECSLEKRLAIYEVRVEREEELVALFRGTVYRKDIDW